MGREEEPAQALTLAHEGRDIRTVAAQFEIPDVFQSAGPYGSGHVQQPSQIEGREVVANSDLYGDLAGRSGDTIQKPGCEYGEVVKATARWSEFYARRSASELS